MKHISIVAIMALSLFAVAHATVWYVHPDSALNSIQSGLDSCTAFDTVLVGPGTYYENINIPAVQGIYLASEFGADTTVIDANNAGIVIAVGSGVDTTTKIEGFTIQRGHSTLWNGAGINCIQASPVIENNHIINNKADSIGGGVFCYVGSSPIIRNNVFENDSAKWGGGIGCMYGCNPIILCNTIKYNSALWNGGGIALYYNSNATMIGNTITDNTADYRGGGIECWGSSASILQTTIMRNSGSIAAGICCRELSSPVIDSCNISDNYCVGIYCSDSTTPEITNCSITGNTNGICCYTESDPLINYNSISGNSSFGVLNTSANVVINAEHNWWGDATGPYHPTANPGGLGDAVSDYVDFNPWLLYGIEEQLIVGRVEKKSIIGATIFRGPLQLPEGKKCKVYDITGRIVEPNKISRGIYFIEVDGVVTQKVIRIR